MKLATQHFLFQEVTDLCKNNICFSESAFKMKVMSLGTLFEHLLMSVAICKQRLLHQNEIVQHLQKHKFQGVSQGHFKKP